MMPPELESQAPVGGPFARAADRYYRANWPGIIPVTGKWPPPTGWTGREGKWPSYPDLQAWKDDRGTENIALRLPDGIIGVDVDNYDGKPGAATLAASEALWGLLPGTWISTSRTDGISGIRLFRVPKGLSWPSQLKGGGVELVLWFHRYVMVAPSIHPEGREYQWRGPAGNFVPELPLMGEIPMLPSGWIVGLVRGEFKDAPRAEVDAGSWLTLLPGVALPMCSHMVGVASAALEAVSGGSRHDEMLAQMTRIIRDGERGHAGTLAGLGALRARFLEVVTGDGSRHVRVAEGEWERALDGAVALVEGSRTPRLSSGDPCAEPPATDLRTALQMIGGAPGAVPPAGAGELPDDQLGGDTWDLMAAELADPAEPADDRSSWDTHPLADTLAGITTALQPAGLARSDGVCLLYPGRVNGIIGPSESGKSWIALEALRQFMVAGKPTLMIDFEDYASGYIERLRAMGLSDETIAKGGGYINPSEPLTPDNAATLARVLTRHKPALIVVDGVNSAMTIMGYDLMSNKDATAFYAILLAPLAETGAIVIYVDHTPKGDIERLSSGGIGAQAKRAMTTGSILRAEISQPFGRGQTGYITLTIDKDRPGSIRAAAGGAKKIGKATLESHPATGRVTIVIDALPRDEDNGAGPGEWLPTALMTKVIEYLQMQVEPVGGRELRRELGGRPSHVAKALDALEARGLIVVDRTGQTHLHSLAEDDLAGDLGSNATVSQVVPGGSRWFPGTGQGPGAHGSHLVHPERGTREPLVRLPGKQDHLVFDAGTTCDDDGTSQGDDEGPVGE